MGKASFICVSSSVLILGIGFGASSPTRAEPSVEFRSTENQVHLIELFSSEGCSSCPPADSWLASLRGSSDLWKKFVPVEFHVDYWNRLGWTDRLSKSVFTERQQNYAREWVNSNVYTPGFVLDGAEWRPPGNVAPWENKAPSRVGTLSVKKTGRLTFYVTFESVRPLAPVQVYGALLGNGLESKVSSGENSGSILRHEFAVLGLTQNKMNGEKMRYTAVVELSPPLRESLASSYSAAFWVTTGSSQSPLQAVGGDITL